MFEHIDFHVSYRCFNQCVFCSSANSIERFRNHPLKIEEIIKLLETKKEKGFSSVNFTGGEPTLYPSFNILVRETKRLGYRVYVGTNGGRFESKKFCLEVIPFLDEVYFSCHGHVSIPAQ